MIVKKIMILLMKIINTHVKNVKKNIQHIMVLNYILKQMGVKKLILVYMKKYSKN